MRILIISRSFPPQTNTRSIQIWKLVNALADQGIKVIVLAGYVYNENENDDSKYLFPENPRIKLHYIPDYKYQPKKYNLKHRIIRKSYSELSSLGFTSWVRRAKKQAELLLKVYKPDLVLSSSTPFESHIVGYHLRKYFNFPWVISLSDPLIHRSLPYPYNNEQLYFLSIYRKSLYKNVLNSSDVIHMYSKYGFKLIEKFIDPNNNKFSVIPHIGDQYTGNEGIDELKYKDKLVFVGHLKKERIPKNLFQVIKQAASELDGNFNGLMCVGKVSREFRDMVENNGIGNKCKIVNSVPHAEAMRIMKQSGALLILDEFVNDMSPILVSKIGEYAMSGRPVLAITPKRSALRDYFNKYGGGIAVDDDKEEILNAINVLFSENNNIYSDKLAQNFYPENIAKEYIKMFDSVISTNR